MVPSHACFAQMGSFQKLWSGVKPASILDTRKPSKPCFHKAPQRNDNKNTPAVLTVSPGAVQTEGLWDWISFCHQPFSVLLAFLKMVFQCFRPLLSSGNRAEFSLLIALVLAASHHLLPSPAVNEVAAGSPARSLHRGFLLCGEDVGIAHTAAGAAVPAPTATAWWAGLTALFSLLTHRNKCGCRLSLLSSAARFARLDKNKVWSGFSHGLSISGIWQHHLVCLGSVLVGFLVHFYFGV